jgi:hypothetical protein
MTRFIAEDGRMPEWLEILEDGRPYVRPDIAGALQLVLAASREDDSQLGREVERIFRTREGLPLLTGLALLGATLAKAVFREQCTEQLILLALAHDEAAE